MFSYPLRKIMLAFALLFIATFNGSLALTPVSIVRACNTCNFLLIWGASGSGNGQLNIPASIALDSFGNVYVADSSNNRIEKFTRSGIYITQWGSSGTGNGQFADPSGVTVDSAGNVYVTDEGINDNVLKFTSSGTYFFPCYSEGDGCWFCSGCHSYCLSGWESGLLRFHER